MADIQNLQTYRRKKNPTTLPNSVLLANRLLSLDVRHYQQLLDLLLGIFYAYKVQANPVAHVSLYHFAQMFNVLHTSLLVQSPVKRRGEEYIT